MRDGDSLPVMLKKYVIAIRWVIIMPGAVMLNKRFLLITAFFVIICTGCGKVQPPPTVSAASPDFFGFGDELAHRLLASRQGGSGQGEKLILTTLVDLDDLYRTSAFGRAMTEALSTCLFKRGFRVEEIRKTSAVYIKKRSGELALTRDVDLVAGGENAYAVVTGTYALTPNTVIVNVRMIEAISGEVVFAAGLEIERNRNINSLLARTDGISRYELSAYER